MASPFGLPPPEPLKILDGNTSLKWKKFKQKWTTLEIATGVSEKENATTVAVLDFVPDFRGLQGNYPPVQTGKKAFVQFHQWKKKA